MRGGGHEIGRVSPWKGNRLPPRFRFETLALQFPCRQAHVLYRRRRRGRHFLVAASALVFMILSCPSPLLPFPLLMFWSSLICDPITESCFLIRFSSEVAMIRREFCPCADAADSSWELALPVRPASTLIGSEAAVPRTVRQEASAITRLLSMPDGTRAGLFLQLTGL